MTQQKYNPISGVLDFVDSTARRFVKTAIEWNGTDMIFTAKDANTTSTNVITNFNATYPALSTLNFFYCGGQVRNGNPIAGVARNLNIDRIILQTKPNY